MQNKHKKKKRINTDMHTGYMHEEKMTYFICLTIVLLPDSPAPVIRKIKKEH